MWRLFTQFDEKSLTSDFVESLGNVMEHSAAVIFFFESFTYHVSDMMDLIDCQMFVAELCPLFWNIFQAQNSIVYVREMYGVFLESSISVSGLVPS